MIAIVKRGTVTEGYIRKIVDGCQASQVIINSNALTIRAAHGALGTYINSATVREMIAAHIVFIPPTTLRIRLMLQQCSWEGLTSFVTIRDVLTAYPDFPWAVLCSAPTYQLEANRYLEAARQINGDEYYGFNSDLGAERSTNYPNLAGVCMAIKNRVGGDNHIAAYAGRRVNLANQVFVNRLIERYVNNQAANMGLAEGDDIPIIDPNDHQTLPVKTIFFFF